MPDIHTHTYMRIHICFQSIYDIFLNIFVVCVCVYVFIYICSFCVWLFLVGQLVDWLIGHSFGYNQKFCFYFCSFHMCIRSVSQFNKHITEKNVIIVEDDERWSKRNKNQNKTFTNRIQHNANKNDKFKFKTITTNIV